MSGNSGICRRLPLCYSERSDECPTSRLKSRVQAGSEVWSYDSMGRPLTDQRTANAVTKTFPYTYNLDSLATITYHPESYPELVTFQQGTAGRYLSEDSSAGAGLADAAHYAPNGSLCSMGASWGNAFRHDYTFNNRFQPYELKMSDLLSQAGHAEKAANTITALTNLLKSGTLSVNDQVAARQMIQQLSDAVATKQFVKKPGAF